MLPQENEYTYWEEIVPPRSVLWLLSRKNSQGKTEAYQEGLNRIISIHIIRWRYTRLYGDGYRSRGLGNDIRTGGKGQAIGRRCIDREKTRAFWEDVLVTFGNLKNEWEQENEYKSRIIKIVIATTTVLTINISRNQRIIRTHYFWKDSSNWMPNFWSVNVCVIILSFFSSVDFFGRGMDEVWYE